MQLLSEQSAVPRWSHVTPVPGDTGQVLRVKEVKTFRHLTSTQDDCVKSATSMHSGPRENATQVISCDSSALSRTTALLPVQR